MSFILLFTKILSSYNKSINFLFHVKRTETKYCFGVYTHQNAVNRLTHEKLEIQEKCPSTLCLKSNVKTKYREL